jgi:hypothetical protein
VIQRLGSKSTVRYIPYEIAHEQGFEDMLRRVPALEKIERLTGWRPTTPLDTCIDLVAGHHAQYSVKQGAKPEARESRFAAGM